MRQETVKAPDRSPARYGEIEASIKLEVAT